MPQAIGALLITLASTAFSSVLVTIAVAVGVSLLTAALFGPSRPKPSDGQQTTREAIGSRKRHYGIVHTGGQLTFFDSSNGTLGQNVTLGTGLENDVLEHRINDNPVTVDGSGTVTDARYHGAIHIYTRSGADDQTAIAELTAAFPAWTADHRQRGCAHAAIIADPVDQEIFSEVFAGQVPQYSQIRKAASLYDPRKDSTAVIYDDGQGFTVNGTGPQRIYDPSTWAWDDNWALVTADYFAHPDAFGGGYDNVNWASVAGEADICEQQVSVRGGGQIDRWRAWASYSLARDERRTVLGDLLQAADGFCWQDANGKFNLLCGRYIAPTVTITDDHISGMTATKGPNAEKRISAVKVAYTEASIGYREQESATIDSPDVADDPNSDPQLAEIYYAPHHNQASRLGKIIVRQMGDRWHVDAPLNLYGLNLLGQRFCRFDSAQLGVAFDAKVDGLKLDLGNMRVVVKLSEVEAEDWNFDAATEEGVPPGSGTTGGGDRSIAIPTGLALSAVPLSLGSANGVAIAATWDDPGRKGLSYEARYRETPAGDWVTMVVDNSNFSARSGPVNSGVEHEVQVRARAISGRTSDWSAGATITPTAAAAGVPAPGSLAAAPGAAGEAVIDWRNPQAAFDHVELFENTADDFGTASEIGGEFTGSLGELKTHTETGLAAGTHYFWAVAFDAADNPSAATGPVTAVVT